MRLRAEAMLKIEEIMSLLSELDRSMVAFEVFRTHGNTSLTPLLTPADNTRKTRPRNTQQTLPVGGAIGGDGSVSVSDKNRQLNEKALEVLEFLNAKASKSFRPCEENMRFIRARLAKHSVEDLKGVI